MAENGFHGEEKMQGRRLGQFADRGRQGATAGRHRPFQQPVAVAPDGGNQMSKRPRLHGKSRKARRGGNDRPFSIQHRHVRIGIVEAGNHSRRRLRRAERPTRPRGGEEHGLLARAKRDALHRGADRQAAEALRNAHGEAADLAHGGQRTGCGLQLPEGDIARGRACIKEVVDEGLAEQRRALAIRPEHRRQIRREQADGIPLRKMRAHPFVNGDIDKGVGRDGHEDSGFSNRRGSTALTLY